MSRLWPVLKKAKKLDGSMLFVDEYLSKLVAKPKVSKPKEKLVVGVPKEKVASVKPKIAKQKEKKAIGAKPVKKTLKKEE